MTTTLQRGSAKIYEFPVAGRAALRSRRDEAKPAPDLAMRAARIVHGSGWYHEAAIEEADRARKRS